MNPGGRTCFQGDAAGFQRSVGGQKRVSIGFLPEQIEMINARAKRAGMSFSATVSALVGAALSEPSIYDRLMGNDGGL